MIARAVFAGFGVCLIKSGDDLDVLLDAFERLHRLVELEIGGVARWPPVVEVATVWKRDERHADRRDHSAGDRRRCFGANSGPRQ
jgi:hypothetical protein